MGLSNLGSGIGIDANELKALLVKKIDRVELERMADLKSNKTDTD